MDPKVNEELWLAISTMYPIVKDLYKHIQEYIPKQKPSEQYLKSVKENLQQFLIENSEAISNVIKKDAAMLETEAEAYSDMYKFTMLPVFYQAKKSFGKIHCTFSLNIRDQKSRELISENSTLRDAIRLSLLSLTKRTFDPERFANVLQERTCMTDADRMNLTRKVAGTKEKKKFLADVFDFNANERYVPTYTMEEYKKSKVGTILSTIREWYDPDAISNLKYEGKKDDKKVVIRMFEANDSKLGMKRWYFESTGPWYRVTWLETSMMQAVYSAIHKWKLQNSDSLIPIPRERWLGEAMVRCAMSVDAMNELSLGYQRRQEAENTIREEKKEPIKTIVPMKHSLMSGRRSGGMDLMVIQTLYISKKLTPGTFFGTSSLTVQSYIQKKGLGKIPVMGTIAHEMMMVLGSVLSQMDTEAKCPLSQVCGSVSIKCTGCNIRVWFQMQCQGLVLEVV